MGSGNPGVSSSEARVCRRSSFQFILVFFVAISFPILGTIAWRNNGELATRFFYDPVNLIEHLPWLVFNAQTFAHLEFPLWDYTKGFGLPNIGNIQNGIFYPLNFLLYLFPYFATLTVLIIVRFFIGFLGFVRLAERLGIGRLPALFGATVFTYNGYTLGYLNVFTLNTEMLYPWVILFLIGERNAKNILALAAVLACAIFGGHPVAAFFLIGFGLLGAIYTRRIRDYSLALIVALGATLTVTVPFVEYLHHSWNIYSRGAFDFHYTIGSIISLVVAWPYGDSLALFFNTGLKTIATGGPLSSYAHVLVPRTFPYLGAIPILAACVSLSELDRRKTVLWAYVFVALALSFGVLPIGHIPILNHLNTFKYIIPSIFFTVALLGAHGFERLLTMKTRATAVLCAFIAGSCGVALMYLAKDYYYPYDFAFIRRSLTEIAVVSFLFGSAAVFARFLIIRQCINALLVIELTILTFGINGIPLVKTISSFSSIIDPDSYQVAYTDTAYTGDYRYLGETPVSAGQKIVDRSRIFMPNTLSLLGYETLDFHTPLVPSRYFDTIRTLTGKETKSLEGDFLDRLFIGFDSYEDWMGMLGVGELWSSIPFGKTGMANLSTTPFYRYRPTVGIHSPLACDRMSYRIVSDARQTPHDTNTRTYKLDGDSGQKYLFPHIAYPGFKLFLDGRLSQFAVACGGLIAAQPSQPFSSAHLVYRPLSFAIGSILSVVTLLALAATVARQILKSRC